jgi:uracil-DNA glycosylase family 4
MGMNESEIYRLLNLAEDYVLDGFRRNHPPLVRSSGAAEQDSDAPQSPEQIMDHIARQVAGCTRCALHRERRQTVSGEGVFDPLVMVIGEGPGAEEDRSGRPFVGRAGQYLDRWLAAIGLDRKTNCFLGNIVKCRPPGNRDPLPEEAEACLPYLKRQIEVLNPRAILTVGRIATQILCARSEGIGQLRGKDLDYRGVPVVATYHPSAVLRNTDLRAAVWEDLKRLRALPVLTRSPAGGQGVGGEGSPE